MKLYSMAIACSVEIYYCLMWGMLMKRVVNAFERSHGLQVKEQLRAEEHDGAGSFSPPDYPLGLGLIFGGMIVLKFGLESKRGSCFED